MSTSNKCKNCDADLLGLYCSQCGQKDVDLLTFRALLSDFFKNILSLESNFFISLKSLIFNPGFLTLKYWSGKRKSYISPFRLYLVLSVFYFFISSMVSNGMLITTEEDDPILDNYSGTFWMEFDEYTTPPVTILEKIEHNLGVNANKGVKIAHERRMTVESIIYSSMSTALFLLMPFMAVLLLKVLYRRNSYLYSHHLIATLHLHSFLFLILILNSIISYFLFGGYVFYSTLIIGIIYFIYSVIMFYKIYNNSKLVTFMKTFLLNIIYGTFVIGSMILIIIGKMVYLGFYY